MKPASAYPVTFAYGAKDGIYYADKPNPRFPHLYIGPYHRGDDRACLVGSPVIVNGVPIGKTGNTGASSGPHLHIGRWIGGKDVNPRGGGFTLATPKVLSTGEDKVNGKYVKLSSNGEIWVYLHLSEINVSEGQVLTHHTPPKPQGAEMFNTDAEVKEAYLLLRGNEGTEAERKGWIGQPKQRFFQAGRAEADSRRAHQANLERLVHEHGQTITQLQKTIENMKMAEAAEDTIEAKKTDELKAANAKIAELSKPQSSPAPAKTNEPELVKPKLIVRIIAWFLGRKK